MTTASAMNDQPSGLRVFAYEAQTDDGQRVSGTMEAVDAEQAMNRLRTMRVRVLELNLASPRPSPAKTLRGEEFIAFNEQLAQLAKAGLPLEQGLRLIASDIQGRRLKTTIQQLAAELEKGTPLDQAFDKFQDRFPPLYSRLIRAGVRSGDLSGMLLGLGRHLELIQRLRAVLWRTFSYPLFVLIAIGLLISFLGIVVLPQYETIFKDFNMRLPGITELILALKHIAPALLVLIVAVVVLGPLFWGLLERLGYSTAIVERVLWPAPLVGPVLKANAVARWCDAVKLGVGAGMDLPAAIELASDATRSRRLSVDGKELIEVLSHGRPLVSAQTRVIPATVPAAIQFASEAHDLPGTLGSLSEMYQRQAELRLSALPGVLTPLMVLLIAVLIGFVVMGLMLPLVTLIQGMTH
jgi:type II secretory pathway component PulF